MKNSGLTLRRLCWWCNTRLMAISHAEVEIEPGQVVWVHKSCEEKTKQSRKQAMVLGVPGVEGDYR